MTPRWRPRALPALVFLAGVLPLLATRPAPLQDWPNHLARIQILVGLLRGDAFWLRFYEPTGFLVPNAVMDAGLLGLVRLGLSVPAAGQVFLLATYGVFLSGFAAAARALGAAGRLTPVFGVLLFYSNPLFWGLVSYVLGLGLLLALLAAWLAAERLALRLGIAGGGAVLLLFTHVVPAVAWVALLGCFDLARLRAARGGGVRRFGASASWLLALVVVVALLRALPGDTGHDLGIAYSGHGLAYILARKLSLFAMTLLGGSIARDVASLVALLACLAVAARSRPRAAAGALLALAGLAALTLAAPERIGTGSLLDQRLAFLPLLLAAAAVRLSPPTRFAWIAVGAVLLRTALLAMQFQAAGTVFATYRRDTAPLPAGAVMLMGFGTPLRGLPWQTIWSPPITSIATEAVAHGLFVPHVFANPAQQPMALRPAFQDLTQPWDLTAPHVAATAAALARVCARGEFAGVYLTVLYPGRFEAGAALLARRRDYLIVDACRLRPQPHA